MKKKMVLSYLMGFSMGLLLLTLLISFFGTGNISGKDWQLDQNAKKIQMENAILTQELEALKEKNAELAGQLKEEGEELPQSDKEEAGETVEVEIVSPINYEEIAEELVTKKVYPHKNDLVMLMEMIHYDKEKGTKALSARKIINDEVGHRNILRKYDTDRYAIRTALYEKGLIQDQEAFSKVLYLLDTKTRIVPGKKTFKTDLSLREIADILMADPS